MTAMRRFYLARNEDPSGISGTGIVAEGIEWRGGTADLHWVTEHETFVHWPGGVAAILAVHGHGGSTIVRFLDEHPLETFDREDRG
jgi:hypothetical protein